MVADQAEARRSTRSRLFSLIRPYRGLFSLGLVAALISTTMYASVFIVLDALMQILFPGAGSMTQSDKSWTRDFIAPFIRDPESAQRNLVLIFLVVLVVKNITSYIAAYTSILVQEGVVRDLREKLYAHILRLDLGVFLRTRGGQFTAGLINDADQVKLVVVAVFAQFFQNAIMILVTLALMFTYSWRLSLIIILLSPILVFGVRMLQKRLKQYALAFTKQRGELMSIVAERLSAIKLIRAAGAEPLELKAFNKEAEGYRKGVIRTQRFALLPNPVSEVFGGTIVILTLLLASLPEMQFEGSILVFIIAATRLMSPVKAITQVPAQLSIAEASADRIFAILDTPAGEAETPGLADAKFDKSLEFDAVTFGYDPSTPVLQNVSFTVSKGDVVALVGPSGAGKTTLLELVPRFYDPQSGHIRLDGVSLPALGRVSLRNLIAVVSQDTILLHDTVRANIAYGRPAATDAEIEAAARAANAHEFIAQLPNGYATVLGERGTRLSGGQRQRISIARALLRDAPILILDEATSALDTESERLVQEAIDRLVRDRTVLVIAHRLATVRAADRIVVMEQGRMVAAGTHAELLNQGGLYRRLHDLQFSTDSEGVT